MTILSFLVFGATLSASVYAIWATVQPEFARIVDLLRNGPVATPLIAAPVPARASMRNVSSRSLPSTSRSPQRAAA
jgi:hypothetical protein